MPGSWIICMRMTIKVYNMNEKPCKILKCQLIKTNILLLKKHVFQLRMLWICIFQNNQWYFSLSFKFIVVNLQASLVNIQLQGSWNTKMSFLYKGISNIPFLYILYSLISLEKQDVTLFNLRFILLTDMLRCHQSNW